MPFLNPHLFFPNPTAASPTLSTLRSPCHKPQRTLPRSQHHQHVLPQEEEGGEEHDSTPRVLNTHQLEIAQLHHTIYLARVTLSSSIFSPLLSSMALFSLPAPWGFFTLDPRSDRRVGPSFATYDLMSFSHSLSGSESAAPSARKQQWKLQRVQDRIRLWCMSVKDFVWVGPSFVAYALMCCTLLQKRATLCREVNGLVSL